MFCGARAGETIGVGVPYIGPKVGQGQGANIRDE